MSVGSLNQARARQSEEFPNGNLSSFAFCVKYHIFPSGRREESVWQCGPELM